MDGLWVQPDDALVVELWPDAPSEDVAATILRSAQTQCEAFAPTLAADAEVPANYKVGLVMQARTVHRSFVAGGGDQIGGDGFTITTYPLDRTVKAQLRPPNPKRGIR